MAQASITYLDKLSILDLERFVKEIRVKKEGDEVMIESVVF